MFHTVSKTGLSGKHSYRQQHASTRELHKHRWLLWLAVHIRLSRGNWEVPNNCTTDSFFFYQLDAQTLYFNIFIIFPYM